VRPRSGLAHKHGLTILNSPGTIDADYRGEVKIVLHNSSSEDFTVENGMRIAQLVVCPIAVVELEYKASLDDTDRGEAGFGHTGI
jgi:dUTP pyrophosphatase